MKLDRFAKRRAMLCQRHVCTRCGHERAENGRKWCVTCLAVESDKRDVRTGAEARRRAKLAKRRDMIAAAVARLRVQAETL